MSTRFVSMKTCIKNRTLFVISALVSIILCGLFTKLHVGAASQTVTVVNAMLKIRPTDAPPLATAAEVHASQNEFEAFQVVVTGPVTGVLVTAPVLVGPNGATIPGSEIRL